jgi:hypothetical protein
VEHKRVSTIAAGLLLILVGLAFLIFQAIPGLEDWLAIKHSWPLLIVGFGIALLLIGLVMGVPEMAIPAAILGGIGGLLWWQSVTGYWESWSFAWTLIPGFVGVGMILAGLLRGGSRSMAQGGMNLLVISLVLFAIFGTFFGALRSVGLVWPALLIAVGALLIVWSLYRAK